jgi:ATP-dependent DNA helicase RecG
LPIEQVIRGGESDCRNRILHQMFLLIGLGERGGSGMPKIYSGWKSQHWRPPALQEKDEPEQTLLSLQMADLLPESVIIQLRKRFGVQFDELDQTGRLVMATAAIERVVSHTRLLEICGAHAHDLSVLLAKLVKQELLASEGRSRGTVYFLPGQSLPTPEQVFLGPVLPVELNPNMRSSSEYSGGSSSDLNTSSSNLNTSSSNLSEHRDSNGRLLAEQLQLPVIDKLEVLSPSLRSQLDLIAAEPRAKGKMARETLCAVVIHLCSDQFITLRCLAELVNRKPETLRNEYLTQLVRDRKLVLAFPTKPTHEKQAYRAANNH